MTRPGMATWGKSGRCSKAIPSWWSLKTFMAARQELWAACTGRRDVVEFLLADKAEVNARDAYGGTPLHYAAIGGRRDVAELLLAKGAEVDARDSQRQTPLHLAAAYGHKEVAELLLAKGAEVDASKESYGQTPLHYAAFAGSREVAELLLAKGAEVNALDANGWTPLHYAAFTGHQAVVELLLANKAKSDARDGKGWTPLHYAAFTGHQAVADVIRHHGGHDMTFDLAAAGTAGIIVEKLAILAAALDGEAAKVQALLKEVPGSGVQNRRDGSDASPLCGDWGSQRCGGIAARRQGWGRCRGQARCEALKRRVGVRPQGRGRAASWPRG